MKKHELIVATKGISTITECYTNYNIKIISKGHEFVR